MKVLINSRGGKLHSTSWLSPWVDYCRENNIDYDILNLFKEDDIVSTLRNYDVLLWHFGQYGYQDMMVAQSILYTAELMGLKTFPGFNDAWHFDDKVAEMFALEAVGAPIPKSFLFFDIEKLKEAIDSNRISFPIVAKLRTGSGSHNVKLLKTKDQLLSYAKRMFSKGFDPSPSLLYKTSSNVRASHNLKTFISKAKRAPEFLRTLRAAKQFPNEKEYVYLQEFIPNDGFDLKVVVVGDKLSYLVRPIRSHDFRASGGGEVLYDRTKISQNIIETAFKTADALKLQCVGFDYVVDNQTGDGKIVEMSYGFSHEAIMGAKGYFNRKGEWIEEPLNAPKELLINMIKKNV